MRPFLFLLNGTHSLKEVIAVGAVVEPALHTAVLETGGQSGKGRGRYDRAFLEALCRHSRSALRA